MAAIASLDVTPTSNGVVHWHDPDWTYYRKIDVHSMKQAALPLGHPITVTLETNLVTTGRARKDLKDVYVIYNDSPIVSTAEVNNNQTLVHFYCQQEIETDSFDVYYIYYGNPDKSEFHPKVTNISQG